MTLRIFDHLFVNHSWHAPARLDAPQARVSTEREGAAAGIAAAERAEIERRSMIARLAYRGGRDPIISRAARRLQADSSLSVQQLAAELGVSDRYLARVLRSALGENPSLGPP